MGFYAISTNIGYLKPNRLYMYMVRGFTNNPRDLGSILGTVKANTQKMVIDASLLNTQQY